PRCESRGADRCRRAGSSGAPGVPPCQRGGRSCCDHRMQPACPNPRALALLLLSQTSGQPWAGPSRPGVRRSGVEAMDPLIVGIAAAAGLVLLVLAVFLARNRSFTKEAPVFRGSRWTRGNHLWPTQVAVLSNRVVRYTPRLFGHFEET